MTGECAAIVKTDRTGPWPKHLACCRPTIEKSSYCQHHHSLFFNVPDVVGNRYIRGLRKQFT